MYNRRYYKSFIIMSEEMSGFSIGEKAIMGNCTLEIKNNKGKFAFYLQGLKPLNDSRSYVLYAIVGGVSSSKGVAICKVDPDKWGRVDIKVDFEPDNVFRSNIKIENFNIFALMVDNPNDRRNIVISPLVGYCNSKINWRRDFSVIPKRKNNYEMDSIKIELEEAKREREKKKIEKENEKKQNEYLKKLEDERINKELEEAEKERKRIEKEREEERKQQELKRAEEERKQQELKRAEEERRQQELKRAEEERRQQELKRAEEERRQQELKRAEEERKQQELKRAEEERRQQELKRAEEERKQQELKRAEEEKRQQELKRAEEERRQQELKREEEERRQQKLKREEEERKQQELKRAEEEKIQQELKRAEEERRQQKLKREEEERRQQKLKREEEERKQQELRRAEEERKQQELRRAEEEKKQQIRQAEREKKLQNEPKKNMTDCGIFELLTKNKSEEQKKSINFEGFSEKEAHNTFREITMKFNKELIELEKTGVLTSEEINLIMGDKHQKSNNNIDYIFRTYRKVKPFNIQGDNTWISITLNDLVLLPFESCRFMKNPFISSGYRKYNHLILGRKSDKSIYYLGVPDSYSSDYILQAAQIGFNEFLTFEGVTPKEGDYGYWLMNFKY